jgi:hypothetical protein
MSSVIKLETISKLAVKREKLKEADTFIIIYGLARSGKTTLAFKLLMPFLTLKRKLFNEGKSEWLPERKWSMLFKKYFSSDAEGMKENTKNNPKGSFNFVDEGLDVVSWHDRLTKEQKDLIELLQKSGKKCQLTILLLANFSILTKEILARAHYLFIIPKEPSPKGNIAFLFRNYKVPFLAEKNPFGLNRMFKDLARHPFLFEESRKFIKYLKRQRRLVGQVKFGKLNQKLYDLYDMLVKEPSIMKEHQKRRMVNYAMFYKLKYSFTTLIYNLVTKDGKTIGQIEKLLLDKFGSQLLNRNLIKNWIDKMTALEVKPTLDEQEIIEVEPTVTEDEDIDVEESLLEEIKELETTGSTTASEEVESHVDTSNNAEESEQKVDTDKNVVSASANGITRSVGDEGNTTTVQDVDGEKNSSDNTPHDSPTLETDVKQAETHEHDEDR